MEGDTMSWKQLLCSILYLIFPIVVVVAVTFLSWYFEKPSLMWWYLLALVSYCAMT